MYIAVLDEFPDYMTPTLVAHSVLSAHLKFASRSDYRDWLLNSFRKCVLRVNKKEFEKLLDLPDKDIHVGHENSTLDGRHACVVYCPNDNELPNVLKFAKLWKPREE